MAKQPGSPPRAQRHEEPPKPVEGPLYYASTVSVQGIANELVLTFSRARPATGTINGEQVMMAEPQAMISISPHTAKDLLVVLQDTLAKYESDLGTIETIFTRERRGTKTDG